MGLLLPTPEDYVSASWQSHKDRNPPSSEPGTDYGSSYGSAVFAVDAGVVVNVQTHAGGGTGRFVEYRLNDGRTSRTLHMSECWVSSGQGLSRGQQIGLSGASGYGDDWYYGPHAHQTLWPGGAFQAPTIDFALYVGGEPVPEPIILEDDMIRIQATNRGIALLGPGYFRMLTSDEEVQQSEPIISKHISGNDRQFDLWASMATSGNSAVPYPFTSTLGDDQINAIAEGVVAALPDNPGGGASADEVKRIVSEALASLVLVSQAAGAE